MTEADGTPPTIIVGRARIYWAPIGTRRPRPSSARCRTTSGRFRAGTRRNRRRERVRPRSKWPSGWRDLGPVDKIELTTAGADS